MHDVFRAGVAPGGLTADYEIKMMICHILRQIAQPMPISALIEVFVGESIGNYFETASAASALVQSGHLSIIELAGEKCYEIAPLGIATAETLEKDLPPAIRDRAVAAAQRFFILRERRAHNKTAFRQVSDGFLLTLSITDIGSDLLDLTILLPDRKTCDAVIARFEQDPVVFYKGVVALLTGSFRNVGELLEQEPTNEME